MPKVKVTQRYSSDIEVQELAAMMQVTRDDVLKHEISEVTRDIVAETAIQTTQKLAADQNIIRALVNWPKLGADEKKDFAILALALMTEHLRFKPEIEFTNEVGKHYIAKNETHASYHFESNKVKLPDKFDDPRYPHSSDPFALLQDEYHEATHATQLIDELNGFSKKDRIIIKAQLMFPNKLYHPGTDDDADTPENKELRRQYRNQPVERHCSFAASMFEVIIKSAIEEVKELDGKPIDMRTVIAERVREALLAKRTNKSELSRGR